MFDFDAGKLLIVGVIALIFIPPKDLPRVLRQVGQFVGKMRRMAADFQGQFMEAMREADMADLRQEAQKLADAARVDTGLGGSMKDLGRQMTSAVEAPHAAAVREASPAAPHEPHDAAFEDLRSELRPLLAEDGAGPERKAPRTDEPADQPHSA